ncbi:MAG: DNA primase [Propionibacteriaceae bacterium]|jgi:DNA primase|nr:DNA primase [Propionibacteriaceae bacterium]
MAGLINPDDLDEVRSRARIDDVVSSYVTLKPAGSGTLKGLCPFHDEKTPSFQVTPARGLYYCFGCGKGGDTVNFVQEINNLSFREAVEFLADKYGVQLRYTDDGARPTGVSRIRLLEANSVAADFFADTLFGRDGQPGRDFLTGRGFDRAAAEHFGIGYAPRSGRELSGYLRTKGFRDEELIEAGLMRRGGLDYFQGRVIWPIRDAGKAVLGFGARRLFDDDRLPAKYVNTPETPIYKKSHVLYGLDLARTTIGSTSQAVIVEGYTDVMACHLAHVTAAVASCGTAFGADHARVIQRLMGDHSTSGQVIFTFDGDQAGRNAALKVFREDALFTASTWAAIEPTGLDPCDLRMQRGDQAIRDLIDQRVPLYRFVMNDIVSRYDLDHADARIAAVREAAPLVTSIRDRSQVDGYIKELSFLVGLDPSTVRREVNAAKKRSPRPGAGPASTPSASADPPAAPPAHLPDPNDRALLAERDTLKLILQAAALFDGDDQAWQGLSEQDFTHPAYRALFRTILATGDDHAHWPGAVIDAVTHPELKALALQLSVEPPRTELTARHAREYAAKLKTGAVDRDLAELKSRMQRTNPVTDADTYDAMFARMIELETARKELIRLATGE